MKWLEEVKEAFTHYEGVASLEKIYKYVKDNHKSEYPDDDTFHAQLRRVIYKNSSDCDIYEGKNNLFMSEDGKGNGIWRMRVRQTLYTTEQLNDLAIGSQANATDISKLSGMNRVKGIHPLDNGVVLLCTINGENYKNEWIDKPNTLKYYLEGRMDNKTGIKTYNIKQKSNEAVRNSSLEKPVFLFLREKSGELFTYTGQFTNKEVVIEADGGKYFVLQRVNTVINIGEFLAAEDDEGFPEGAPKERLHKSNERNPRLVKEAKNTFKEKHGRVFCEVCSFDFEEFYGKELGEDFIEAHHKVPLHTLKEGNKTKISDLAMVCSNCHRMLHRMRPWITPGELKKFLKKEVR